MEHDMNNGDHNLNNIYIVVPDNHPAGVGAFDTIVLSSDSGGIITWPLSDGTRYVDTQNATGYTGKRLKVNIDLSNVGGGAGNNTYTGTATFSFTYNGVTTLQSLNYSFDFDE